MIRVWYTFSYTKGLQRNKNMSHVNSCRHMVSVKNIMSDGTDQSTCALVWQARPFSLPSCETSRAVD